MIAPPRPETLAKYGLSLGEWRALLEAQGGVCWVCEKEPKSGRLNIDHHHVKGWKDMTPGQRKVFVRGLLCHFCNRYYVSRSITIAKSRRVTAYLERFEARELRALLDLSK